MSTIQTNVGFAVPQDDVSKKKIKDAFQEISDSLTRMAAERDLIKDIIKDLSEEFEIPKKQLNKAARTYHKQNFSTVVAEQEEFEILYETITK